MQEPKKLISTGAVAGAVGRSSAALNMAVRYHGHFCGIVPTRLPNGRLAWPADAVDTILGKKNSEAGTAHD